MLLRYTMNAVFRLDKAGVVVRMAPITNLQIVDRVAEVADAFARRDLPTARLAPGIDQPTSADGWIATIWTLLPQRPGRRHDPVDLAEPLRAMHAVPALDVDVPAWNPLGQIRGLLTKAASLEGADHAYLRDWSSREFGLNVNQVLRHLQDKCDELGTALKTTDWTLPQSVVHGDPRRQPPG